MPDYIYESFAEKYFIGFIAEGKYLKHPGVGYFSGGSPDYITSVEGVPKSCTVRVFLRGNNGGLADMAFIKQVQSAPDGSWYVGGLDPSKKYDVICRYEGYNDMIISNVSPKV